MLTKPVAGALDLDAHRMVKQAVQHNIRPVEWVEFRFCFTNIDLSVSDLVLRYQSQEVAPSDLKRRGRRPEYDWDAFYAELTVRADLDGLPAVQSECERM